MFQVFSGKRVHLADALRAFRNSMKSLWKREKSVPSWERMFKSNPSDFAYIQSEALIVGLVASGLLGKPSKERIEDIGITVFQMLLHSNRK